MRNKISVFQYRGHRYLRLLCGPIKSRSATVACARYTNVAILLQKEMYRLAHCVLRRSCQFSLRANIHKQQTNRHHNHLYETQYKTQSLHSIYKRHLHDMYVQACRAYVCVCECMYDSGLHARMPLPSRDPAKFAPRCRQHGGDCVRQRRCCMPRLRVPSF